MRRWLATVVGAGQSAAARQAVPLTFEPEFIDYLAARRGISTGEARAIAGRSQDLFAGGWGGDAYRDFTGLALEALRPLCDESPAPVLFDTYRAHAPFDFLRMLSYPIPDRAQLTPVAALLAGRSPIVMVDYGCGLAQRSIALARLLKSGGSEVRLVLVDINRRDHFAFLKFLCARYGIGADFIEVSADNPFPELPPHDYCDVVNVFEHIADPVRALDGIDAALRPGGWLMATMADQDAEMMHVSPRLDRLRGRFDALAYQARCDCLDATLWEKAGG